jgi:hypothetical protein
MRRRRRRGAVALATLIVAALLGAATLGAAHAAVHAAGDASCAICTAVRLAPGALAHHDVPALGQSCETVPAVAVAKLVAIAPASSASRAPPSSPR